MTLLANIWRPQAVGGEGLAGRLPHRQPRAPRTGPRAGGHADHTWHKRLGELARPAVLILDDFAMRELTPAQADDLYELITERASRSLVLTSNRAPQDWYPLFPNPVVAESLLDRVINNSHQVFMNEPSYRPNKRPGQRVTTTTQGARPVEQNQARAGQIREQHPCAIT